VRFHFRPRSPSQAIVVAASASMVFALAACAPAVPTPAAAEQRTSPPPWNAPRDAISNIEATGLEVLASGYRPTATLVADLKITVDGKSVEVPAFIGIDRIRNVEAPLHTHANDGTIWVEHPTELPTTTLGQFFDLWGVRFDEDCLGAACKTIIVRVDGKELDRGADPRDVEWKADRVIEVDATS
jgi:hypothetical protein